MSTYKIIDSSISLLYCAQCANEFLEAHDDGRIICTDCGMTLVLDPKMIRVGQVKGTKYKMRDNKRYAFRELVDIGREDAFSDVFIPSPEPGRRPVGWKEKLRAEDEGREIEPDDSGLQNSNGQNGNGLNGYAKNENGTIHVAGVDDAPPKGWRNESVIDIISDEANPDSDSAGENAEGNAQNGHEA